MPFFSNIPSLSVRYEDNDPSFSYNTLSLSDSFPDANQLRVLWVAQTIYQNDILINVSSLTPSLREKIQTIPSNGFNIDVNNKTITPAWGGLEVTIGTDVYRYVDTPVISASEPLYILRSTDVSQPEVDFQPGSRLTSEQLNTSFLQNFLAVQELAFKLDNADLTSQQNVEFINDLSDVDINTANAASFLVVDNDLTIRDSDSSGVLPLLSSLGDVQYTTTPTEGKFLVRNESDKWVPGDLPFDLTSFSVSTQPAHSSNTTLTYSGNGVFTFTPLDSTTLLNVSDSIYDFTNVDTLNTASAALDNAQLYWDYDTSRFKWSVFGQDRLNGLNDLGPFQKTTSTPPSAERIYFGASGNTIGSVVFSTETLDPASDRNFDALYYKLQYSNYIVLHDGNQNSYVRAKITGVTRSTTNHTITFNLDSAQVSSGTDAISTVSGWNEVFVHAFYVPQHGELKDFGDVGITSIADNDLLMWNDTNSRFENVPVTSLVDTSSVTLPYVEIAVTDGTTYQDFETINLISTAASDLFTNVAVTGNSDLINAIDEDEKTFVAPKAGPYEVSCQAMVRPAENAVAGDDYNVSLEYTVNGVVVSPIYKVRDDAIGGGSSFLVNGSMVIDLQQGDILTVRCWVPSGVTARLSNYNVTIKQLIFDTTLLIDPDARITARPVSSNRTSDEVSIGVNEEGYPLYERYFEVTNDFSTPNIQFDVWDFGNEVVELIATDVEAEYIRARDNTSGSEYRGDAASALFGFYLYLFENKVRGGRTPNAPITSNFGSGSTLGVRVQYTKRGIDSPDAQYIIVSSGFTGVTGVSSVNGDPGPDVVLSSDEIRVLPGSENPFVSDVLATLETDLSNLTTTVNNIEIPVVNVDFPPVDHTHTADDITGGEFGIDLIPDTDLTYALGAADKRWTDIHGDLDGAVMFRAKNGETNDLVAGEVVYISGTAGNGETPLVKRAQSNSDLTMPAFGFVKETAGINAEVHIVTLGLIRDVPLPETTYSVGDILYVSETTPGGFTNVKPQTETNLLQNIGYVVRTHDTNGELVVGGSGRTNAVPNLNEGNIFIGNENGEPVVSPLADEIPTFTIQGEAGTVVTYPTNSTLTIQGGNKISTTSNDQGFVTVIHDGVSAGTIYNFPTSFQVDSTGHVGGVVTASKAPLDPDLNLSDVDDPAQAISNLGLGNTVFSPEVDLDTLPSVPAGSIVNIVKLTQAQYDDIASPDATTLYVIV